jgi:hypothetical protein
MRVQEGPLYGPLASRAVTSASRKCAFCKGVEKAAPGRRAVEEKKRVSPYFVDPAPKINLVEAYLNRPSLQAKGTIALHSI